MSSSIVKPGAAGGKAPSNPSSMTSSNPSLLLDKFNGRRSTPDSEALASSDDEGERQDHHQPAVPQQKPTRRASWLNDTTPPGTQPRKGSFASNSLSPTTSHPTTPTVETTSWNPHAQAAPGAGRGHTGSGSFTWGSGIWNNESRKEPPSRLTEVLPSPTSMQPPGTTGNGYFNDSSNYPRDPSANPTIPFAIPLHPTPKTYRSQSYSVGQLDPDPPTGSPTTTGPASAFASRGRPLQPSGLQHRPSRPSMLSEMSNEGGLSKLKEVEDDDDNSTSDSNHGSSQVQSAEAKTIELLARENAILRQQQYNNLRNRPRSSTSNAFSLAGGYGLQGSVPEESDYAIDELDEINELQDVASKGLPGRRLSEFTPGQIRVPPYGSVENRKLENVKKAYWQSSLGFGGLADIPQSRRHSFADVPTRQGSGGSSTGEPLSAHETSLQENMSPKEYQSRYQDGAGYSINDHAASYFGGVPRNVEQYSSAYPSAAYNAGNQYGGGRPSSPHRNMYGVPQPRHNQLLYIVLFKCSRADVFYVQEGTGLSVKPGDLVIVEADRGTDLGTVARDNVDWNTAKELKEHYAEEHYKWLMMYSQGAAGNTDGTGAGLMAASNGLQGSAVGGMGPPNQHGMQEPNPGEIKPKIIKRLAQNHEIQALRDKEGNEAKAKRVCMQKVKEHGLHMEILDAEFQMDWKKLTFYYFADAYINFNSLVTDLFKVYKTRIWMSAINPASFASPSLGLQAPSGIGPGAVGVARNTQNERRPQQDQASFGSPQAGRGYSSGFPQQFVSPIDRGAIPPNMVSPTAYTYGYSPFAASPRTAPTSATGYASMMDPFGSFPSAADYQGLPARFPSPHGSTPNDGADYGRQSSGLGSPNDAWISSFQGLSMNTR